MPGCYYLVRRDVIEQVGLFDPRFFVYYEEVDHCRAARSAGWRVVYYPFAQVVHLGGESAKSDGKLSKSGRQISQLQIESELMYVRKHYGLSGLLGHLLLAILTDGLIGLKGMVRRRPLRAAESLRHSMAMLKVLKQSRFATSPTR